MGESAPHSVGFVRRTNSTPEIQSELIDSCAECGRVQAWYRERSRHGQRSRQAGDADRRS